MVLCALEQSLSSYWLHLETLEAGDQHVFQLLPWRDCSRPKGRIPRLSHTPNRHDEGLRHDGSVATI
jgi:hypothetical protein